MSIFYSLDGRRQEYQPLRGLTGYEGLIGNTPMVKLHSLSAATGCDILVKVCLPCTRSAHSRLPDPFDQSRATFEIFLITFHFFQTIPTFL